MKVDPENRWENLDVFDPRKAPRTAWIVEDLIPEGHISVWYGDTATFKSSIALDCLGAASRGEDWEQRKTLRTRVLIIDNENLPDVLRMRDRGFGLGLPNDDFKILDLSKDTLHSKLYTKEGIDGLRQTIESCARKGKRLLVVLDHWATFLKPGESGHTTGETTYLLQDLKKLCARYRTTFIIIVHTKKNDPKVIYGGKDLIAKSSAIHLFTLRRESENPGDQLIVIESSLVRHGGKQFTWALRPRIANGLVVGFENVDYSGQAEKKETMADKVEKIKAIIGKTQGEEGAKQKEIIMAAVRQGLGHREARRILKDEKDRCWHVKTRAHNRKAYFLKRYPRLGRVRR